MTCARCGKRYIGAAAHGNGGRYAYYVCFTRQRYGMSHCDSDRLPAQALEDAILEWLVHVLDQEPLVRQAISDAFLELDAERPKRGAEIKRIDDEIKKTDQALERYFRAFEHGSMPEAACAPRITELTRKLDGLHARHDELAPDETQAPEPLSEEDLHALRAHARQVIETGDPPARKALLQAPRRRHPRLQPPRDLPDILFARGSTTVRVSQCARQDSNLRLPPPEGGALSTELRARGPRRAPAMLGG